MHKWQDQCGDARARLAAACSPSFARPAAHSTAYSPGTALSSLYRDTALPPSVTPSRHPYQDTAGQTAQTRSYARNALARVRGTTCA